MAPEHASGGAVDRRSDIWSLGAVAYFMLAGRYPFDGPNDAARLIRILGTDGPDELPESVAPAVRDVVLRALSKDPDARYETAAELASALEISKLPATHKEVASFFQETLAQPMRARRALVEHALAAADARARAREMLDGPAPAGASYSYRPPPVIGDDDGRGSGTGTLGTVTRSHRPPAKPWVPWLTAAVIGFIVITAFALGSMTARPPVTTTTASPNSRVAPAATVASGGVVTPQGPAVSAAETQALALADARAKAEAEAPPAKAAAADAGPKTASTPPAKTVPAWAAWPPPATSKAATSAVKPPIKPKPPEREDTIF
jgi:serine/threonine-protein kinase